MTAAFAADPVEIRIGYLGRAGIKPTCRWCSSRPTMTASPARLAIEDNNTTGRFQNQRFASTNPAQGDDDPAKAAATLAERGISFIVADLPATRCSRPRRGQGSRRRSVQCRRQRRPAARTELPRQPDPYRADAFDARRRPRAISGLETMEALAAGDRLASGRQALCDALRRAATRFGAKIVQERTFEDAGGARHTDSGVTLIQRQIPVFTQQAPTYDVLVAPMKRSVRLLFALSDLGRRPVAGSAGLMPTSWDATHDQWGAVQMQNGS